MGVNTEIIAEMRAALEQMRTGKTGWLSIKPNWFDDIDQTAEFMAARGKARIQILEARIAAISGRGE